jgi:O-acetyl-ADP-ribose deacetylase (regulator of RNase III)
MGSIRYWYHINLVGKLDFCDVGLYIWGRIIGGNRKGLMIQFTPGDIFESSADVLINPVNTVGVMGGGLALTFKKKYPDMFNYYKKICDEKKLVPGSVAFWGIDETQQICLFPTKRHYIEDSTVELIERSLQAFQKGVDHFRFRTAAFPMVGCGLGGLDFESDIRPLMERYFKDVELDVTVFIFD